jgi:aryl-alcohol dehydrogenase-like predicted oxidoreductase
VVRLVAIEHERSPAQIALAWLLCEPPLDAVVVGATRLAHIDDALGALDATLDERSVSRLEALCQPHAIQGHD